MHLRPSLLPALAVFTAAARHQNFAHAAEELHLTASAVSHQVRKLEAQLGLVLFQRHARGVRLTSEGRQLADAAVAALGDVEAVAGHLHRGGGRNTVSVTALHSLVYCWLLPRLGRFHAAHPDIRLRIDTGAALTRFEDGSPELGLRYGPGQWPGLAAHYLMDDELMPVASPALPGIDLLHNAADILRLPLVTDLAMQGWRDWFHAAGVRSVELPDMHSFSDSTDAMGAAVHGLGAALGRRRLATPYLQRGELVQLPGPALKTRFSYYLVHPAHQTLSPAAQAFRDWLKQEANTAAATVT